MEAMAQDERYDLLPKLKRTDGGQSHSRNGRLELLGPSTPAKSFNSPGPGIA